MGAADIYDGLSRSANPQADIREITREELIRTDDYCAKLPDTGWPGVVKALIRTEAARRYFSAGGGR
jgi:hypothetical protein